MISFYISIFSKKFGQKLKHRTENLFYLMLILSYVQAVSFLQRQKIIFLKLLVYIKGYVPHIPQSFVQRTTTREIGRSNYST